MPNTILLAVHYHDKDACKIQAHLDFFSEGEKVQKPHESCLVLIINSPWWKILKYLQITIPTVHHD